MGIEQESSYQDQVFYHFTPTSPSFPDPKLKCENRSENRCTKVFGCLESEVEISNMNGGMYDRFLMDNMWNTIPCSDLLALADVGTTTNGSGCGIRGGACSGVVGGVNEINMWIQDLDGGSGFMTDSHKYERPEQMKYLFDLNSLPTATEPPPLLLPPPLSPPSPPLLITDTLSEITPATPKRTRRTVRKRVVSDIINSNTDEKTNEAVINLEQTQDDISDLELNEEFDERSSDDLSLVKTPQPKPKRRKHRPKVIIESQPKTAKKSTTPRPNGSTGKRKYTRKISVEGTNEEIEATPVRPTRNSCRRKISFEEEQMYDKAFSPITPNKPERANKSEKKSNWKAKRNMNFSRKDGDGDDNGSNVLSRNDSTCSSTNAWFREDALRETYLSMITYFPPIYKKERTKICRNLKPSRAGSSVWSRGIETSFLAFGNVETFRKRRSKSSKRVRDLASFVGILECKQYTCLEALAADFSLNITTKKRTARNFILPSSSYYNHYFLKNYIGFCSSLRWKSTYDMKALTNQFENLSIKDKLVEENRHALVPYLTRYQEKNGLVLYRPERHLVPFEGYYDEVKRRKPRPKVDLDDETSRVWRLLLEDINSQGIDGTDEDNTKWWEEERNVFSGRATSFIARMRLVQGDRRFSRWKGSVVDSVIGVFLTQNVSDHLSSSAFMNLAARYPLKSKSSNGPLHEEKSSMYDKESRQLNLEETIKWHEDNTNHQPIQDHSSMVHGADSFEVKEVVSSNEDRKTDNSFASTVLNEVNSQELANGIDYIDLREITVIHNKNEEKCASEQSGTSAESAIPDTVEIVNTKIIKCQVVSENTKVIESNSNANDNLEKSAIVTDEGFTEVKKSKTRKAKKIKINWDNLRKTVQVKRKRERTPDTMDSVDYEAVRCADVDEIADTIKDRGMNNMLAERIKNFLNRLVKDHGSIDLEWLRDVPPDKAKEYLLSFRGLGLKSVECVRLLTLHHLAFPVDTNVGRIAVRLGWVPLQPLPETLQLHLLELYPVLESIQKYLWPRLCKLDQRTLYELHYQMITFGKVFCTKNKPNCNACPMRGECRHFASAFASARLALPAPEEKSIVTATINKTHGQNSSLTTIQHHLTLPPPDHYLQQNSETQNHDPVIEEPATPEPEKIQEFDIEDFCEDTEEIPTIKLNMEAFTHNLQNYMENNMEIAEIDMSRALVALTSEAASIPTRKLKNVSQLRTEHHVYELPDSHPLLEGLDNREPDDPCFYLLAIWTPGETAESIQPPKGKCSSQESGTLCHKRTCFLCNSRREANSQTVRGTLLIPCRTAMRGSFPLNGTYFQVNEVFADHDSSLNPIDVPRSWLWNLPRRTVYFGTSIPTIFRGLTTESIQYCFWRGFVCVRGFDQKTRAPRPLMARLHFPASKLKRSRGKIDEN